MSAYVDLLRLIILLRHLRVGSRADFDAPRLQLLRHLAHEIDHKQTVFHVCPDDLHMVSEIEALLKAPRNALVYQLWLLTLLAVHEERTPVLNQFDFVRSKA